jgi:hypothetical protein
MTLLPSHSLNPQLVRSVAIRVDSVCSLPTIARLLIALLIVALLAAGISPDAIGVLLALLGLVPLGCAEAIR